MVSVTAVVVAVAVTVVVVAEVVMVFSGGRSCCNRACSDRDSKSSGSSTMVMEAVFRTAVPPTLLENVIVEM